MEQAITKSSTPAQLLELALSKERAAVEIYEQMMRHASGGMMQELLIGLRDDETRHVRVIEKKLNDLYAGRL
jgi:rubrerythrin